jgi:hypothetical protein
MKVMKSVFFMYFKRRIVIMKQCSIGFFSSIHETIFFHFYKISLLLNSKSLLYMGGRGSSFSPYRMFQVGLRKYMATFDLFFLRYMYAHKWDKIICMYTRRTQVKKKFFLFPLVVIESIKYRLESSRSFTSGVWQKLNFTCIFRVYFFIEVIYH